MKNRKNQLKSTEISLGHHKTQTAEDTESDIDGNDNTERTKKKKETKDNKNQEKQKPHCSNYQRSYMTNWGPSQ